MTTDAAPNTAIAHGSLDLPNPRPVLSVAEAADLLGVSQWLLLQQIRLGTIPHKRCGRRIVISRERLLQWITEGP
jgi:excisionase family DNA binding protein